jgi:hypothetical protein
MKSMRLTILLSAALLIPATHALAETGARQDSSSLLVWAFWAMCALIVAVQLRPAAYLFYRLLKELLQPATVEEDDEEPLSVHRGHR